MAKNKPTQPSQNALILLAIVCGVVIGFVACNYIITVYTN